MSYDFESDGNKKYEFFFGTRSFAYCTWLVFAIFSMSVRTISTIVVAF